MKEETKIWMNELMAEEIKDGRPVIFPLMEMEIEMKMEIIFYVDGK